VIVLGYLDKNHKNTKGWQAWISNQNTLNADKYIKVLHRIILTRKEGRKQYLRTHLCVLADYVATSLTDINECDYGTSDDEISLLKSLLYVALDIWDLRRLEACDPARRSYVSWEFIRINRAPDTTEKSDSSELHKTINVTRTDVTNEGYVAYTCKNKTSKSAEYNVFQKSSLNLYEATYR
jgi:hypothetical protein